jgi:UDP-N-acetylglucosamine 2-epimerase (non-hydrolysing)
VLTGCRAEYGLLHRLLLVLRNDDRAQLQLIVTGTHLSERFGFTIGQIESDGFEVAARVPIAVDDDSIAGVSRALSAATVGMSNALRELRPDLLVLLGDRYEVLAAAQAALIARIPVAHIHGGEVTEGAIDEAIRHAVTKMSHLHFTAAEPYRQRVIQLGESPDRVWNVGATGLDNIENLELVPRVELEELIGVRLVSPTFLVTYHPVTLSSEDQGHAMRRLLEVLDETGGTVVITGVNADPGGARIRQEAIEFAAKRAGLVALVETLGVRRYLSVMAYADAVVGNSSSGLLEAPAIGTPTVDIGERQRGRLRAPSVVHCSDDSPAIRKAVLQALSDAHREIAARRETPYGTAGASERIASIITAHPLDIVMKRFHDVEVSS